MNNRLDRIENKIRKKAKLNEFDFRVYIMFLVKFRGMNLRSVKNYLYYWLYMDRNKEIFQGVRHPRFIDEDNDFWAALLNMELRMDRLTMKQSKAETNNDYEVKGIYKIINKSNNRIYIGKSIDIHKRWKQHINKLNNNDHENKFLQENWNKYHQEAFVFKILETVTDESVLQDKEKGWFDYYEKRGNIYNIANPKHIHPYTIIANLKDEISLLRNEIKNLKRGGA